MLPKSVVLCDRSLAVVEAWRAYFTGVPGVEIVRGDIFEQPCDAVVSPGNSFGDMNGGLDSELVEFFGLDLEVAVMDSIREKHGGELLVGLAEVVSTESEAIPYVVAAPTMRVPQNVSLTANAYLAFRGALRAVREFNEAHGARVIDRLLVSGLGTLNGYMPPLRCARQMRAAYDHLYHGKPPHRDLSLDAAVNSTDGEKVVMSEAMPPKIADR